jgi:coproporphyrinogen III oxidase-like Fe-S oxidoreductase
MTHQNGKPLDHMAALQCRDDILQVMYWMRGEELGEEVDEPQLSSFLAVDESLLREQLEILVEDGMLAESTGRFRLTEQGLREGGRRFHDEFADLQKTAHGECGPDCPYCRGIRGDDCPHCSMVA